MTWRDGECWATRVDSAPHVPSEAVDVVYTSDVLSCQGHGRSVGASATPAQWATRAGALLFCMCCDSRRRAPRVGASRALPALLDETRRLRGFVASLLMVVSSRVLGALVTGLVSARHAMLYARDARGVRRCAAAAVPARRVCAACQSHAPSAVVIGIAPAADAHGTAGRWRPRPRVVVNVAHLRRKHDAYL